MDKRIREDILYRFKLCRNKNIFYLRDRFIPYGITEWLFVVKMIFRKLLIDDWEEDERKEGRNEWFDREIVFRVKLAETTKKKKKETRLDVRISLSQIHFPWFRDRSRAQHKSSDTKIPRVLVGTSMRFIQSGSSTWNRTKLLEPMVQFRLEFENCYVRRKNAGVRAARKLW